MGSFFSKYFKKNDLDIETSEGWDQRMQEFQDKKCELADKKKSCQRRLSNLKVINYVMIIPVLLALYLVYLHIHNLTIVYFYPFAFFVGVFILLYVLKRRSLKALTQYNEEETLVLDDIKKHIDALSNVKACFPDISRLALKYNIDTRVLNSKEVESRNHDIKVLLHVIRKLIELPLCKDCRYYTRDERHKILDMIPPHYASLFTNVEPQKAEDTSKPLDERFMALVDKEENEPVVIQKVQLLEDHSQMTESVSQAGDEVQVEEITDETEESELRQRHVTNID